MSARLGRFLASRHANAAIEFALTVPVLLLIMAGIVEFGRAYQAYGAVNRLASRYALAWADCSDTPTGTCATELLTYVAPAAIKNFVPQLTNSVQLRMFEVTISGTSATVVYSSPTGAVLLANELTTAQTTIASGQTGVVVTVTYSHTLAFFQTIMAPFLGTSRTISYTIAQQKS